jgi:hypothetical protein
VNGEPASRPGRQIRMRRTLGTLIVPLLACTALLLGGCGASSSSSVATDPSSDPASDPAGNPSWTPGPIPGANVLPLISMTGGGGVVSPVASILTSPSDLRRFLAQLRVPALQNRVRAAVRPALNDPDHIVVAQVVAVGCDRPPGVGVIAGRDGRVQLVPQEVASPLEECLAAVTTVAVAVLPID